VGEESGLRCETIPFGEWS